MKNYFQVNRHIFESERWLQKPFDESHAWLDMVGNANYKDGTVFVRGNAVKVKRGQLAWSIRFMMDRWGYTQKKTLYYLECLKRDTQIKIEKVYPISLITIVNYEKYQSKSEEDDTQEHTQKHTQSDTTLNKDNKNKQRLSKSKAVFKTVSGDALTRDKLEEVAKAILDYWNKVMGKQLTSTASWIDALGFWVGEYSYEEIKKAMDILASLQGSSDPKNDFWQEMSPVRFFRRANKNGAADYISELLSINMN